MMSASQSKRAAREQWIELFHVAGEMPWSGEFLVDDKLKYRERKKKCFLLEEQRSGSDLVW